MFLDRVGVLRCVTPQRLTMIEDILQSAKQTAAERFSSPLIGAFLVSWAGWNWKFLVILFSDATVTTTFDLVHRLAFPDWTAILLKGFALPLITSLAYVFLYPYPARFVYEFTLMRQRETNETKQRVSNDTLLTLEDSIQLRSEIVNLDRRSRMEIKGLNEEIFSLKAALDKNINSKDPISLSKINHSATGLTPHEFLLLSTVNDKGGEIEEKLLTRSFNEDRVTIEFRLGELKKRELVDIRQKSSGNTVIFTHEGRRAFLNYKKSDSTT